MIARLLYACVATLSLSLQVSAEEIEFKYPGPDKPFTKKNISPVAVVIGDNARGGCWTNLSESEQYAKEQLKYLGIETVEWPMEAKAGAAVPQTNLRVYVQSDRSKTSDQCYGAIVISFGGPAVYLANIERIIDEPFEEPNTDLRMWTDAMFQSTILTFMGRSDANIAVIDTIERFVSVSLADLPEG